MRRFLFLFILLPLAIVVVALSVVNRGVVTLSLDPFGVTSPAWSVSAPLYVLMFATLSIGVSIGGCATWLRQRAWRHAARSERAKAERLSGEVDRLRKLASAAPAIAGPPADRDAA